MYVLPWSLEVYHILASPLLILLVSYHNYVLIVQYLVLIVHLGESCVLGTFLPADNRCEVSGRFYDLIYGSPAGSFYYLRLRSNNRHSFRREVLSPLIYHIVPGILLYYTAVCGVCVFSRLSFPCSFPFRFVSDRFLSQTEKWDEDREEGNFSGINWSVI